MNANLLYRDQTDKLIKSFYSVYNELGYGFLEKVYENAMFKNLLTYGLRVDKQVPIDVFFQEERIGTYYADLILEDSIIIEIKTGEALCEMHEAQLINYLKATHIEVGFLLNFGPTPSFRRKYFKNTDKKIRNNPNSPDNPSVIP